MAQKESPPTGGGDNGEMVCSNNTKKSLYTQRMLSAFSMGGFVKQAQRLSTAVASQSSSDEEQNQFSDSSDESEEFGNKFFHQAAARSYRERMFDFSTVGSERMWLKNLLLSETETESEISDVEDYIQQMLKDHVREKKIRERYNASPQNSHYGYYSAGLLSDNDLFPEHRRSVAGKRKCKIDHGTGKTKGVRKKMKHGKKRGGADGTSSSMRGPMYGDKKIQKLMQLHRGRPVTSKPSDGSSSLEHTATDPDGSPMGGSKRGRKMRMKTPEALNIRRRKMWQLMAKKEVGKLQRAKANNHKDTITNCRRVAALCMRVARQKAMQSQKLMKDTVWRAKRLTREMQVYWKRYDKVERETKRRMEREAEEQRKIDVEIVEAKRQQRKLNFLITQTELYAHFMSRKLGNVSAEEQLKILSQLDEESNPRLAAIDNYDCERMKQLAQKNATDAFRSERARTNQFDVHSASESASPTNEPAVSLEESKGNAAVAMAPASITEPGTGIAELPQPSMFRGRLKGYQLKGVAWLANLYDQGISGILADEMGLGKTVQSIAFLCHIAEHYGVWGPFLVISPASTLHNWQQEMERFVPEFNVVPYWGSPNERKILRQFWEQKHLHTKDASFHVVITSYQLVVTDYKYFNRIKWQYMVLDEAQAIKSSSSMRWKLLLGFNCRNRLLLSGTPIQNSMAELWALLHFIMPTLFDSHEEFNEWFSKDIESHAENKTGIDEKQISRLHMILKPFMLRRIKKDVENELSDKIEIMVYCPLTTRQKLLYVALKKEICIEDLLNLTTVGGGGSGDGQSIDRNFTSNLMNLVMQFRKVCNHPELFERRDVRSPFCMKWSYELSERPIFRRQLLMEHTVPSKRHWLYNRCYIFTALQVQRSMAGDYSRTRSVPVQRGRSKAPKPTYYDDWCVSFSCARLAGGLSPKQVEQIARRNVFWFMYQLLEEWVHWIAVLHFRWVWSDSRTSAVWTDPRYMLLEPSAERWTTRCFPWKTMEGLLFTHTCVHTTSIPVYTHREHVLHFMSETLDHRIMRSRKQQIPGQPLTLLPEVPYAPGRRLSTVLPNEPTTMPKFLCRHHTKVLNTAGCNGPALRRVYTHRLPCSHAGGRWYFSEGTAAAERQLREHVHASYPAHGWSNIIIPDKQTLVSDAGKLAVLDSLLARLKEQGHRVLIYSQMTKMIDLLEEYMRHRKHRYMRLDGSSKISERRDMVADFQNRADIFVFLLSTRAGGLGINLTAADTVIFYDSDWNPTVDQQAMDRAHRLGQTKQVTVYRLICKGTIEERILQRAREKSEIQRMVINGDNFKPDTLKPKEVVSLLLDDEEIELKYRQKTEERRLMEDPVAKSTKERDRKQKQSSGKDHAGKDRKRTVEAGAACDEPGSFGDSAAPSPAQSERSNLTSMSFDIIRERDSKARPATRGGSKRGRPRGSRRGGAAGSGSTRPPATEQQTVPDNGSFQPDTYVSSSSSPAVPLAAPVATIAQVRRGPGRPRLKTNGPSNQGSRGPQVRQTIRIRKPIGPLVVPLGGQTAAAAGGGNRILTTGHPSKSATPSSSASAFPYT
uniref:Chromatin-remodeling ATPase INO80 n=1 Tax=Anopheles maculatus TaxID=74869 RepID=A0A182SK95_9DIPT